MSNSYADQSGVCSGDSGGGLSVAKKNGADNIYFLEGIVSNGKSSVGGCDLNFFSLFTYVQKYSKMINMALDKFNQNDI